LSFATEAGTNSKSCGGIAMDSGYTIDAWNEADFGGRLAMEAKRWQLTVVNSAGFWLDLPSNRARRIGRFSFARSHKIMQKTYMFTESVQVLLYALSKKYI
jgi:hypothetical protein